MKIVLVFGFVFGFIASSETHVQGELRTLFLTRNKLSYECEIQYRHYKARLDVSIDTETRFMETHLEEGVVVKGFATETFDPKTQTTIYFVQGSSAPNSQQLSLHIRNGGKWAEFTRTYGGYAFVCSSK